MTIKKDGRDKQIKVIIGIAVLVLIIAVSFYFLGPKLREGPVAGQATSYGGAVASTNPGQWGIKISAMMTPTTTTCRRMTWTREFMPHPA